MKKPMKRLSKIPPAGWPTEEQWRVIDTKLNKGLPTKLLSKNAGPVARTKHEICSHFVRYFNGAKITQKQMAQKLDVTESRVSEILHYHFERFTIDKLLELLARIRPDIKVSVA